MKKRYEIQRLALFLILILAVSTFSAFPGLTNAQESIDSGNTEWTPSAVVENNEGDLSLNELSVKVLSEADIPEVIDTDIIAEKQHVNRLWVQESDMNTIVFQNTDGTKSMYYYGVPVKYTNPDGVIRDKSNKVIENQDKAAYPGYAYQNKANDIKTLFPQTLSQEVGVILENAETKIELRPYNYSDAENYETSATTSSARKEEYVYTGDESADAVIYDNVFGDSTKLRYTPTFMGFKEDLILEQNIGTNQFGFILKAGELQVILENGCIYLIDPLTGEIEATVSPIYVYDSYSGVKSYENTHDTWNNEMTLKELDSDGSYLVAITVDEEFLNNPDTVYPVYVDPTLTFDEAADINDAIIYSGSPSVAHGSNYYNYIGYYNSTYGIGRLLVKFPGMTGDSTYSSLSASRISSVTYYAYTDGTNAETSIRPYIYTGSAWTESTITCNMTSWNGTVTLTDMPATTVPNSAGNIAFDITAAAKAWKAGTYSASSGLMLKNSNESSSSYYKIFTSTEYGVYYGTHMPYTEVDYSSTPVSETSGITSGAEYFIQNYYSGKHLDVYNNGTSAGTRLIQYDLHGAINQKFKIDYIGSGEYKIVPKNTTGKVISVNSSGEVMIDDDCDLSTQRWYIYSLGSGKFSFVNKSYQTQRMSVNGSCSNAYVYSSTVSSGSEWKVGGNNLSYVSSAAVTVGVKVGMYGGAYYYDYTTPINNMLIDNEALCYDHRIMSWEQYVSWCYDISIYYEPSWGEYEGMKLGSFWWFYNQVKTGGVWDLKVYDGSRWNSIFSNNVPWLGQQTEFLFEEDLINSEALGNITYGYWGRATWLGDVTLYWGGGVAKLENITSSELQQSPYYGDDADDHWNIKLGIDIFDDNHSNAPIGHNGIPTEAQIAAQILSGLGF